MIKHISFLGIFMFLCFSNDSLAAEDNSSVGKVSVQDLEQTLCPIDSLAKAYYIYDMGYTYFIYNLGFKRLHERQFRIKILDESAINKSTFNFEFYGPEENIEGIKGTVYRLVNGKIKSKKLRKAHISRSKIDKYYNAVSFTLPNVEAGDIIDVSYSTSTRSMHKLMTWQFQYDIPVLYSNYNVEVPEYFKYKQYALGNVPYKLKQFSSERASTYSNNTAFQYLTEVLEYTAQNIPAHTFKKKVLQLEDYPTAIEFELFQTNLPMLFDNISASDFSSDPSQVEVPKWEGVIEELVQSSDFSLRLKKKSSLEDEAKIIMNSFTDSLSQVHSALHTIQNSTKWNGVSSLFSFQDIETTMQTGTGSVSDINLALVALLCKMGLEAYPVAIKTIDKGFVRTYNPSLTQFNYTVAACILSGEVYLLDATDDNSTVNSLPARCFNGKGLLINPKKVQWVDLIPKE